MMGDDNIDLNIMSRSFFSKSPLFLVISGLGAELFGFQNKTVESVDFISGNIYGFDLLRGLLVLKPEHGISTLSFWIVSLPTDW
jgi:hypothetical protein